MVDYSSFSEYSLRISSGERVWQADPKRKIGNGNKQKKKGKGDKEKSGEEEDVVVTIGDGVTEEPVGQKKEGRDSNSSDQAVLLPGKVDIRV